MTRDDFRELFVRSLNLSAEQAEVKFSTPIPRSFVIKLYGTGCSGQQMSVEDAFERLYLDDEHFFRVVDLFVLGLLNGQSVVFVRASDHPPDQFKNTWSPSDLGPFKPLVAGKLKEMADRDTNI